jgi:hypothetical protein
MKKIVRVFRTSFSMRREQSYHHSAVQYRHDTPYEPDLDTPAKLKLR